MKTTSSVLEAFIENNTEATLFFESHNGYQLSTRQIEEYSTNAAILNAVKKITDQRAAIRKMCGARVTAYWQSLAQMIMNLDSEKYPHTLPMNARRLRITFETYQEFGYEGLIRLYRAQDSKTLAISI